MRVATAHRRARHADMTISSLISPVECHARRCAVREFSLRPILASEVRMVRPCDSTRPSARTCRYGNRAHEIGCFERAVDTRATCAAHRSAVDQGQRPAAMHDAHRPLARLARRHRPRESMSGRRGMFSASRIVVLPLLTLRRRDPGPAEDARGVLIVEHRRLSRRDAFLGGFKDDATKRLFFPSPVRGGERVHQPPRHRRARRAHAHQDFAAVERSVVVTDPVHILQRNADTPSASRGPTMTRRLPASSFTTNSGCPAATPSPRRWPTV